LFHLQQQISSSKRILTPSDDPVAAARALEVTQASDVVAQFKRNQDYAISALGLEEAQLSSAGDVLTRVRELAVQGNSAALSASDRQSIATELRSHFEELLGVANSTDGNGQYIFSGFKGATTPFAGSIGNVLAGNDIVYQGDDGQSQLQVSASRQIEVSNSGNDVFKPIVNGNGYFATGQASGNSGTGIIDSGTVTNPATWNAATTKNIAINFTVAGSVTTYDIVDTATGNSLLSGGLAPAPVASQRTYQSGQPIVLGQVGAPAFDLGGNITITGAPANGDSFSVVPSTSQSVFAVVANLISAFEAPSGTPATRAKLSSDVVTALTNIDQVSSNILRVRSQIGSRLGELDSLSSQNQDLNLQYQQTLSSLQDLDYAKAITDLTRNQTALQAAQQSFVKISQLSLFNYL
jgi:flagellar hook-associated protein 3 FlgL